MTTEPAAPRSAMDGRNASYHGDSSGFVLSQCSPRPQPALGFQRIIHGNGTNVGTVIALRCPDKHKLIGDSVKCVMDTNSTYWVGETYCKPLSYNEAHGFQLAVLLSIVSSAVILLMSTAFLTCCLVNCIDKRKRKETDRDSEMPPQWLGRPDRHQEVHASRYNNNNNSRNNNNNNFTEREMSQWSLRGPGQYDNYHMCRCQQSYYDPMGSSSCYVAAARLSLPLGYENSQPLLPRNPTSLYPYSQPFYAGTLNSDLVHGPKRSDSVREYEAKQSCLRGAPNQSWDKHSAKECTIRVISV